MLRALSLPKRFKLTALLNTASLFIFLLPSLASGQGSTPDRGFQPGGSYALSDIETVDTMNGNLMLNLALGKLGPGRGGLSGQLILGYNSKLYDSRTQWYQDWDHMVQDQPQTVVRNMLVTSDQGGWHYGTGYEMQLIDRMDQYPPEIAPQYPDMQTIRHYKLKVAFPDGSLHEFLPRGFGSSMEEGYYDIRPDGFQTRFEGGIVQDVACLTGTLTYYTFDGTYIRLEVQHDSDAYWWNNPWTLYFPDGTKVTNGNRITDRNGNYVEWSNITHNGHPATQLMDQMGRKIIIEYQGISNGEIIHVPGVGGVDLTYQVHWKNLQVFKTYSTYALNQHNHDPDGYPDLLGDQFVVSSIDLPAASGGLQYVFGYNAVDYGSVPCCTPSYGWGELSSVTLPSGALAEYKYSLDGQNGPGMLTMWNNVLLNGMYRKTLTYQREYDGNSTLATEVWNYGGGMITPDGGRIRQLGEPTFYTEYADGSTNEKIWLPNQPQGFPETYLYDPHRGFNTYDPQRANFYVKTEFTSVPDVNGTLAKTAIKDYTVDKNGNVTSVKEYDWVDYGSVPRNATGSPTGIPASAVLKRVTTSNYVAATPDASDSSSNDVDSYWNSTSPGLRNVVASSEVSDGATTLTRAEFFYDNPATTGNLTQQKQWDSTKGGYSNPLTAANSISTSTVYNQYGSPTLTTDAGGVQTQIVYGTVGNFTDLYPTQIKTAYQTTVQRTETREYDFTTGAVTRVTDVDNNVATATTYDVFGRPTLVKAAEGKTEETRTATEYSDVNRRVIVRSDLNAVGDGKLVTIRHYDQLGRIRLTRQLEDATTQSATDETTGIKVQTRYLMRNPCQPDNTPSCLSTYSSELGSYQLVSNPYRANTSVAASAETTMGWTRSRSDKGGRTIATETFAGASLPYPWGTNSSSTGVVVTSYDANATTVMDQAGKVRRSIVDGLGRLSRVDEPDSTGALGSVSSPNQATSYTYNALDNLTTVVQGEQTRTFVYDSLKRLTSAANPESGTVNYGYDSNGNLTSKVDARSITTSFVYDALNRNTSVNYSNTTIDSPDVPDITRFYDGATNGKGRFWYSYKAGDFSVGDNVEATAIDSYDALGRPLVQRQLSKLNGTWSPTYQISRAYNRAGAVISQNYPSGNTVTYSYDMAGRTSSFVGTLGGSSKTYSNNISYSSLGGLTKEQFGTSTAVYHNRHYNARGQLCDVRASNSSDEWGGELGALVNHYSTAWVHCGSGSDNNGNVLLSQTIINSYYMEDRYTYDALNRLTEVSEWQNGATNTGKQRYNYDRWGNRTIDGAQTWGTGINNKQFTVDMATNRLGVPTGQTGTMSYDAAGNLTNDTYTGAGAREYDAENKMTRAWGGNNQWQEYTYNADGQRTRRKVDGQETWQIYGMEGELLAEYAANGSPGSPQKEYGYRNGELLVTTDSSDTVWSEDAVPAGAASAGDGESWNWVSSSPGPFSGGAAHQSNIVAGLHQHYFYGATATLSVSAGDKLVAYVYLDPSNMPSQIMLQWAEGGSWEHRAYWGADNLPWGVNGTNSRRYMGPLPAAGSWVRLEVPASLVGLEGYTLHGTAFSMWGGRATWDRAGKTSSAAVGSAIQWLVSDHLGTPRMVFDETGSLANVKRHDYLPFGEELFAPSGGRSAGLGYASGDGVRQQFTAYERDGETGLNYANARFYSGSQGRFTSVDPLMSSAVSANPQTMNRYSYVNNSPLKLIDPTGLLGVIPDGGCVGGTISLESDFLDELQNKATKTPYEVNKDKTIADRVEQLKKQAKPLAPGVTAVLTNVEVIIGDTVDLDGRVMIDAYGRETEGPVTGTVRPVAYVPLDQERNIIPEASGIGVQEIISVDGGNPEQIPKGSLAPAPPGGVFFDMQFIASGQPTTKVTQEVLVAQISPTRTIVSAFHIGKNFITKDPMRAGKPGSISVTTASPKRVR